MKFPCVLEIQELNKQKCHSYCSDLHTKLVESCYLLHNLLLGMEWKQV